MSEREQLIEALKLIQEIKSPDMNINFQTASESKSVIKSLRGIKDKRVTTLTVTLVEDLEEN